MMDAGEKDTAAEHALPEGIKKKGKYYHGMKDGSRMVLVPEGKFIMGTIEEDIFSPRHQRPQREVYLSAYLIDAFPVTNSQYRKFIDDGGYENARYWSEAGWRWRTSEKITGPLSWRDRKWNGPRQPVAGVSWFEACAYATWAGKRLPTEAEWEKAARGTDGRLYPWGDNSPRADLANYNDHIGHTTKVDAYPDGVSPYGCFDMSGNVNNWCEDWYWEDFYTYCRERRVNRNPVLNDELRRELELNLAEKVDRGGGYATGLPFYNVLSCPGKVAWPPEVRNYWNGFRTVKDMDEGRIVNAT